MSSIQALGERSARSSPARHISAVELDWPKWLSSLRGGPTFNLGHPPHRGRMSDDLDPNKLAFEFLHANLDRITDGMGSLSKFTRNRLRAHLDRTYSIYLTHLLQRYSKSKSFFVRSEPRLLYDFYVPMDISTQHRTLPIPGISDIAAVATSAIIAGTAGAGKSLFMRHLLIDSIKSKKKIPIFAELRDLNKTKKSLLDALLDALNLYGLTANNEYLDLALRLGHFCIILDGFDEVEFDRRDSITKKIRDLSDKYSDNWLILSSRHDSGLEGWTNFGQFSIAHTATCS
jgi:hypothetical protein